MLNIRGQPVLEAWNFRRSQAAWRL